MKVLIAIIALFVAVEVSDAFGGHGRSGGLRRGRSGCGGAVMMAPAMVQVQVAPVQVLRVRERSVVRTRAARSSCGAAVQMRATCGGATMASPEKIAPAKKNGK